MGPLVRSLRKKDLFLPRRGLKVIQIAELQGNPTSKLHSKCPATTKAMVGNVGAGVGSGGGGAAAPAAGGAAAPAAEEKKEEKVESEAEESDDDMGFSLFG